MRLKNGNPNKKKCGASLDSLPEKDNRCDEKNKSMVSIRPASLWCSMINITLLFFNTLPPNGVYMWSS